MLLEEGAELRRDSKSEVVVMKMRRSSLKQAVHSEVRLRFSAGVAEAGLTGEGDVLKVIAVVTFSGSESTGGVTTSEDVGNRFKANISDEMAELFAKRDSIVFEDVFDRNESGDYLHGTNCL